MTVSYRSKKLEIILNDDQRIIKNYGAIAKKLKQRHEDLLDANTLQDVKDLSPLRLHQLKGSRKNEWAITIQKNWRLCFQLLEDPPVNDHGQILYVLITQIEIISVEDYH